MFTFPSRTTALTFTDWRHLEFKIIHAQRGKEIQRKTIIGILGKKKHMRRQSIGILPPPEGALQDQLAGCWKSIFICVLCIIYLMKWGPGLEHSLKMFCEWLAKKRRELLTLKLHELWRWPVCQEEYFDNVAWDIIPNWEGINLESGSIWPFLFSLSAVAVACVMNRNGRRRVVLNLDACRDLLVHRSHLDIECRFTCCLVWNSKLLPIPRHCLSLKISGLPRW